MHASIQLLLDLLAVVGAEPLCSCQQTESFKDHWHGKSHCNCWNHGAGIETLFKGFLASEEQPASSHLVGINNTAKGV
jgi:hypothetical protein